MNNKKKHNDFGALTGLFLQQNSLQEAPMELPERSSPRETGQLICRSHFVFACFINSNHFYIISAILAKNNNKSLPSLHFPPCTDTWVGATVGPCHTFFLFSQSAASHLSSRQRLLFALHPPYCLPGLGARDSAPTHTSPEHLGRRQPSEAARAKLTPTQQSPDLQT